ncbi:site-specific DNA-methyltransferase [Acinetobacter nectaris]|uniref:site-specific DNA-methyltransferase n=1 Tax=Acinetobacter nectaris TaxID=1219382 RepID=UPI001F2B2DBF|nr:site-specific DNA-methyltransferase [Acinetobacter nectaris]MCF9047460.1 site-specific DNA-methyltransferase [Acinetobacter nectaris]
MDTALIQTLKTIFKQFPEFWNGEDLQRSLVIDAIQKKEAQVIKALVSSEKIKSIYATDIDGMLIFDFDKLTSLLKYKEYWANSFTKYRNKVGLTSEGKYLDYSSDVVLDFPFKDCVLEGGMTKDDQKENDEIYYNEVIARDEIDRLFSPKVFTNSKRYTKDGVEENITEFNDQDNLIIKGNNLIALHSLKERYEGKVKLIYIDPPYNTGTDSFKYNDRFNHSTWLTFMKNRLLIAKELLSNDGFIFVQCDDNEQAYLKVLMDEIFGRNQFLNVVTVKTKIGGVSGSSEGKSLRDATEFINIFSKEKTSVELNPVYTKTEVNQFIENYKDEGKSWKYTQVLISLGEKILLEEKESWKYYHYPYAETTSVVSYCTKNSISTDEVFTKYANQVYRTTNAQSSVRARIINDLANITNGIVSIEYVPQKGKNKNKLTEIFYNGSNKDMFMFLSDMLLLEKNKYYYLQKVNTLWDDIQYNNLNKEGGYVEFANGKKPEALIKKIVELSTNEKDIILDFHLGSGTTCAVAHKMSRRYIGIEQMDYINDITVPRLQKVIEGEQGGISKTVNWQGGGSFVYTELMELNYLFIHQIEQAKNTEELLKIFDVMKAEAHLNYQVALDQVLSTEHEIDGVDHFVSFNDLELSKQKQLLIEVLDKNQLYVNASEMDDENLAISESDKAFTTSFYQKD